METFDNVFQCGVQAETDPIAGHWRERFFHNEHPIVLELGCGRGEYTVGLAEKYPEKNFIGVDIKGARMWAGAKQAIEKGLGNAAFLRTNIEFITSLQRYQQIVKPNGLIHLKTDSPFLYTYTMEMLRLNPYPVVCSTDDLYAESLDSNELFSDARALKTHYEKQWLDRGMNIKYIEWQLAPLTTWEEPTIEIEKDNYRSYGRNYNSERKEHHA